MILVLNTGSSSVKFGVYREDSGNLRSVYRGSVVNIGSSPSFSVKSEDGLSEQKELDVNEISGHEESIKWILDWTGRSLPEDKITAVGHRVVHGGPEFGEPVLINHAILENLIEFEKLAPLHQPYNVAGISAVMKSHPGIPQIACFDTAFHQSQSEIAQMYGIPAEYYEEGVRRYGFHGLSYEYISSSIKQIAPSLSGGRLIIAHLGNGASMCAVKEGRSVSSTMGFTALDGLPMGTRSGSIDPGVIFYLIRERGIELDRIEDLLYKKSGLLGISGMTNDMKVLESSDEPGAKLAVEYFAYRAKREIGSLTAALGGLDALIFTAGIGENSPHVRDMICRDLGWLNIEIDPEANTKNEEQISMPGSSPAVYVVPTNEELMIAMHTVKALST